MPTRVGDGHWWFFELFRLLLLSLSLGAGALGRGVVGPALHPVRAPIALEHVLASKCRCFGTGAAHDRRWSVG